MKAFSRRAMLKSSLLAPAVAAAASGMNPVQAAMHATAETAGPLPTDDPLEHWPVITNAFRERLLLDFGWRFHFGHADDQSKDFEFGGGRGGNFQKTGNFLPQAAWPSTIATGGASICPMIGPSSCLFRTTQTC